MAEMVKLTPERMRDWYSFDTFLPSSLVNWEKREELFDRSSNAIDWLGKNSDGRFGFCIDNDLLVFRLESRDDHSLLSLHWSSM